MFGTELGKMIKDISRNCLGKQREYIETAKSKLWQRILSKTWYTHIFASCLSPSLRPLTKNKTI